MPLPAAPLRPAILPAWTMVRHAVELWQADRFIRTVEPEGRHSCGPTITRFPDVRTKRWRNLTGRRLAPLMARAWHHYVRMADRSPEGAGGAAGTFHRSEC